MPDEPTYKEDQVGDRTIYTCLIPDAGAPDGICGHKSPDEGFMTQHMQQRHAGVMVKAPPESGDAVSPGDDALSSAPDMPAAPPSPVPAESEAAQEPTPESTPEEGT